MCPTSPAYPPAPVSGRPPTITPLPRPTSPVRKIASEASAATPRRCSAITPRSPSLPTATGSVLRSWAPSSSPSGTSTQPRFGASRTSWPGPPTIPGTATPMPTGSVVAAASSGSTSARTRSSTFGTAPSPRGCRLSRRSSTTPPRPTLAADRCSTPMSTASAQTASERGSTRIDGRPAPPRPTGAASRTRPASASSVVSARTVLRFSPLTAVSSARDAGPRTCSRLSSTPRLCRRTSSWVTAGARVIVPVTGAAHGPVSTRSTRTPVPVTSAPVADPVRRGRWRQPAAATARPRWPRRAAPHR